MMKNTHTHAGNGALAAHTPLEGTSSSYSLRLTFSTEGTSDSLGGASIYTLSERANPTCRAPPHRTRCIDLPLARRAGG